MQIPKEIETAKDQGMAGSLFFELKRKKIHLSQQVNEITNEDLGKLSKGETSQMQDRHTKNVIYKAIRNIITNAKEQKVGRECKRNNF